jgi:hypothetical protein
MSDRNIPNETEMPLRTLYALRGSIAKWEGIVAGTVKDEGPDNCPLCQCFFEADCAGCPVYEKTGLYSCEGSPYEAFSDAEDANDEKRMALAARAELDFLKSLLPREAVSALDGVAK